MDEIKQGLDDEFIPLEPMLSGLRLIEGGLSDDMLERFERDIELSLPESFKELVRKYDFGRLTIGPVVFCNSGDYLNELTKLNIEAPWWKSASRPNDVLMVANSDPFAIFLNLDTGCVLAMDAELGWKACKVVARAFDLFVRGVGTTMLSRGQTVDCAALGRGVASEVGSSEQQYWIQLAQ